MASKTKHWYIILFLLIEPKYLTKFQGNNIFVAPFISFYIL